jgi:hypothetical protein
MSRAQHPAGRGRRHLRPVGPPSRPAPDPTRLAATVVIAWDEVRAGLRPFTQLAAALSPAMRGRLGAEVRAASASRRPGAAETRRLRVRSASACHVSEGVTEASVVVEWSDGRIGAVAVRLERHLGAWRVVELGTPEAGTAPLATASLAAEPRDAFDEVLDVPDEEDEGNLAPVVPLRPRGSA